MCLTTPTPCEHFTEDTHELHLASRARRIKLVKRMTTAPHNPDLSGELNLRFLQPAAKYVEQQFGVAALSRILEKIGLDRGDLDGKSRWGNAEQVRVFFDEVYDLVGDDDGFKKAAVYRMKESFGPVAFLLRATSPGLVLQRLAKTMSVMSRVSSVENVEIGPNFIVQRYRSTKPESRPMCLSRQAQGAIWPTLWGLPPARITESSCIARGDDCCTYRVQWYQHQRVMPALIGFAGGVTVGASLFVPGYGSVLDWIVLSLLGTALGYMFENRRNTRLNLRLGSESAEAMTALADENTEARMEILALHRREREWNSMLEQRVAERMALFEQIVEKLHAMREAHMNTLRGVSHDLHNPLYSLSLSIDLLNELASPEGTKLREILGEQRIAVDRMAKMLDELMECIEADNTLIRIEAQTMKVPPLVDELRKRLKALVHGKDIRVSVLSTREAPGVFSVDPLVFDRVVDNLLTNAAKYTERGSIVVELSGTPTFFIIKVSDTGRGIAEDQAKGIFHAHGSDGSLRTINSYGVGLSVVVQLLHQIGGRLEVMSIPGSGTTFWAHFPLRSEAKRTLSIVPSKQLRTSDDEIIDKVVTIRKHSAS
jgi:signal transduction histidine kinase